MYWMSHAFPAVCLPLDRARSVPPKRTEPLVRLVQADQHPADRGLAAAGLADQAERPALRMSR